MNTTLYAFTQARKWTEEDTAIAARLQESTQAGMAVDLLFRTCDSHDAAIIRICADRNYPAVSDLYRHGFATGYEDD